MITPQEAMITPQEALAILQGVSKEMERQKAQKIIKTKDLAGEYSETSLKKYDQKKEGQYYDILANH